MSIGNGTNDGDCITGSGTAVLGYNNMSLECPLALVGAPGPCDRVLAKITRFNATEEPAAGPDAAQINMTAVATFAGGAPNSCEGTNIGEAGIWNNSTSGPSFYGDKAHNGNLMFARNTFGSVNLGPADSLELTWKFTFTDS